MAGFNGVFVARVAHFKKSGNEIDMNGNPNVVLELIAGKAPSLNKRVINGTVALSSGMVLDDAIAVSFVEKEQDATYGRQFQYTKIGRLTTMEALGSIAQFGMPEEVNIESVYNPEKDLNATEEKAPEPESKLQENTPV